MPGHSYDVVSSKVLQIGRVITLRQDLVRMPDGQVAQRDVVEHPGAVGVVAVDEQGQVVLVQQYRHPLGERLWELPAGLRDEPGEDPQQTGARELAEETGLVADHWEPLISVFTSPGMTDELIHIYFATGLRDAAEIHVGGGEEAELVVARVALAEAVRRVEAGEIRNAMAVIGLLAAARRLGT